MTETVIDKHCDQCRKPTTHQRRSDGFLECVSCRVRTQMLREANKREGRRFLAGDVLRFAIGAAAVAVLAAFIAGWWRP